MSLEKLCLHTITTKPWDLRTAAKKYAGAGIGGISIWRDAAKGYRDGLEAAGRMTLEQGLEIVSYVRGGFFSGREKSERQAAINENRRIIDEAAALGAPLIVLVCGATPGQSLFASRDQIADGIAAVMDHAEAAGVRLAIEPLHPMYADSRSAVSTMKQAGEICDRVSHSRLGITVDVFHVWWDDALEGEIQRAGESGRLFSYHICDWKDQPDDMLNDRGLMGEGVIDIAQISCWVERAGFRGYHEVEIFSNRYWAMDQDKFLQKIVEAYRALRES